MLYPVEIEIEGFRSFVDNTLITFPKVKRGAVLINGRYKDGSTSSGSGKSSILMAMAHVLGFCDVPSTELKSWYGKKLYVRLQLSDGANVYDIIRDPSLKLSVNGVFFEGTATGVKEKLDGILQTSPDLVKALTYRPQRERGVFLSNTDKKNKEFLTKILGLDAIEDAAESFSKESSLVSSKITSIEDNISQLKAILQTSSVSDEEVEAAQKAYQSAVDRLNSLQSPQGVSTEIKTELENISSELNKIHRAESEVSMARQQNLAIRQKVEQIQADIKKLESGICPTCEREWDRFNSLIETKKAELSSLANSMKSNLTLISSAEPLVDGKYKTTLLSRQSVLNLELGKLSSPINDAMQTKTSSKYNLDNLLRMKGNYDNLLAQLAAKETELVQAKIESHILTHTCKILGRQGFLGGIFDEVLVEIKSRANDLMSGIPNINTLSLDISSTSVTQGGKVNKEIKVSVFKDGVAKSIKSLSGGQIASLELCTDLAVSETIKARSGSNLGWTALDEAMDGLDAETKMAALEVIKSKVDGVLIVVDHSTEIKEAFDTVINVEFDGKKSLVVNG